MGGIYIHVPFCLSRCIYCDFYSTTFDVEWKSQYVSSLMREMASRRGELSGACAHTLYVGGGTPSQLPPEMLLQIFQGVKENFSLADGAEVTIEVNPDDVTPAWLDALQDTPVNRISVGVQSLNDDILRFLHRRHDARGALDAIDLLQSRGYQNISIDLIYGLPGQSFEMWQKDLRQVLSLQVAHLSSYSLQYEEGTRLMSMLKSGQVCEADEELSLAMYEHLMDAAASAGMHHYEISNFCQPGMHSRHNSSYWHQLPYLGLGPGAHSYDGKRLRRWNSSDLKAYVRAAQDVPHEEETLSDDELYDEFIMTRLRTCEGVPLGELSQERRDYCLRMAQPHLESGKMEQKDNCLRLTRSGIFVSDDLMSDLMC
ncbi:MAG: radical SAM family heme chaperone HemW [Bacteroidaceae bacterium]|nr:radical SAM family heme chaperone HemW [Bacteroidaceae bacterium]